MAARQTLTLFVRVQILHPQPKEKQPVGLLFFVFDIAEGFEGRVSERLPGAGFPAPPLRPQAGKSFIPSQKKHLHTQVLFSTKFALWASEIALR